MQNHSLYSQSLPLFQAISGHNFHVTSLDTIHSHARARQNGALFSIRREFKSYWSTCHSVRINGLICSNTHVDKCADCWWFVVIHHTASCRLICGTVLYGTKNLVIDLSLASFDFWSILSFGLLISIILISIWSKSAFRYKSHDRPF